MAVGWNFLKQSRTSLSLYTTRSRAHSALHAAATDGDRYSEYYYNHYTVCDPRTMGQGTVTLVALWLVTGTSGFAVGNTF